MCASHSHGSWRTAGTLIVRLVLAGLLIIAGVTSG
jgi:hypothetical protein